MVAQLFRVGDAHSSRRAPEQMALNWLPAQGRFRHGARKRGAGDAQQSAR